MTSTHIVKQGENLVSIACKYKIGDWKQIYNHPNNKVLKRKRPNPDIILPGDKLYIPAAERKRVTITTGKIHPFVLKRPKQTLRIKLEFQEDLSLEKARAVLTVDGQTSENIVQKDGLIEMDVVNTNAREGQLDLYMGKKSDVPDYTYTIGLSHLDPIDEITGIQARLNALGFDCGNVDGAMDHATQEAIKAFQSEYQLKVDGIAGSSTKDALTQAYGC